MVLTYHAKKLCAMAYLLCASSTLFQKIWGLRGQIKIYWVQKVPFEFPNNKSWMVQKSSHWPFSLLTLKGKKEKSISNRSHLHLYPNSFFHFGLKIYIYVSNSKDGCRLLYDYVNKTLKKQCKEIICIHPLTVYSIAGCLDLILWGSSE